jgi:hypothetical protein
MISLKNKRIMLATIEIVLRLKGNHTRSFSYMRYYSSIIGILFVLMAEAGYSQADLSKEKVQELVALNDQLEGTWQIQMVGTRSQPIIPINLIERIEAIRSKSAVKYFYLDPKIRIMVLPLELINSQGFSPVKRIAYIGTNEVNK